VNDVKRLYIVKLAVNDVKRLYVV